MLNSGIKSGGTAVMLRRWRVVEVVTVSGARSRHVWGHDAEHDEGRVSSAIVDFKMESMTATTTSGARFKLLGLPGHSRKGETVWEQWCSAQGVVSQRDVTNDYMDPDDVSTRQFVALNDSAFFSKPK